MTSYARVAVLALFSCASIAIAAPAAQAAFGPEIFEAGTCVNHTCTYPSVEANPKEAFTQAAGHPPWGITSFTMKHSGSNVEGASVRRIRVDVPPGLAANPQAPMPKCSVAQFNSEPKGCAAGSIVGSINMEAVAEPLGLAQVPLPSLEGTVYNLDPPAGLPLDFGIAVEPAGQLITPIHLFLEGHVDWSGDYHEFFEINEVPKEAEVKVLIGVKSALKVLSSKLNFNGNAGGNFLTVPSICSNTTVSHLELESWTGEKSQTETHTPVGVTGCDKVPFKPTTTVTPETSQSDAPDGAVTTVTVPQNTAAGDTNTSDIKDAHVTLPEGLTLNPAAAHGLEACTAAQIGIGTRNAIGCPAGSNIGTVALETDLPPGSLKGNVYLGSPSGAPITDPPFTIYLVAQNTALDVSVRLQGLVNPNPVTGRLEVTFANNPQLPFSELVLKLNGGPHAPLANPLACGATTTNSLFTPYTGGAAALPSTPFVTTGCPAALPFALSQSTPNSSPNAGAYTSYTFNLARPDGNQYLSHLKTVLPAGLVGAIPSVPLCGEPQAATGSCAATSKIGTATASVGSGSDPYPFTGPVFLTGPYGGSPYGLSIPINAAAGPFSLGTVLTRVAINVDPHTGRVIADSALPTIFKGIPLRLKSLSVAINRPNFLFNPTNCGPLTTDTSLTSTFGAGQSVATPFVVGKCNALAFKPMFKVSTIAKTTKAGGAGLQVNLTAIAHEANLHSVVVQLPKQLPSRLTTLQHACPEATYAANPHSCPSNSLVGTAVVDTPVLPSKLIGPAYLVSHGGAGFPDLDLLLEGDGVHVILVGNTNIKGAITTSTFASIPDVPVSSFQLNLPTGPNSALATNLPTSAGGNLCGQSLIMPTTITGQNGAQIKQNTSVAVAGCTGGKKGARLKILSHKIVGHKLVLRIQTFAAGRVSVKNKNLRTIFRHVKKASKITIKVPLSRKGTKVLAGRSNLKLKVRVGFLPALKAESVSVASASVKFKH
jgi:hypothetical protein